MPVCRQKWSLAYLILPLLFSLAIGCHAGQSTATYKKDGLSFSYPDNWKVDDNFRFPGTRRSLSVESPDTSLVLIEMYAKDILNDIPKYRQHDASLKQFAKRYNKRDVGAKLSKQEPVTQSTVKREGWSGLTETQHFQIGNVVNSTLVREFYRFDTNKEVVFITMDTSKDEFRNTATGLEVILKSFKYQ